MKLRLNFYTTIRILFGLFLVLISVYDAIKYSGFLGRLDTYFESVSIFDFEFLKATAPLVPFEKFVIGFFMMLGMFTKKVLAMALVLFGFFSLFLLDASYPYCALIHFGFFLVSFFLLKNNHYDLHSGRYNKDSFQII